MTAHREARFAIYFTPPVESLLYQFGSACVGRDAATGDTLPHPIVDGVSAEQWQRFAASPGLYGFHATLKPPFRLAAGRTREELIGSLETFAMGCVPIDAASLRVARISNFIALVLTADSMPLGDLAAACVRQFDRFRAPSTPAEIGRRNPARLTPRQQALLAYWGYPYVLDEWRFHMTLASGLDREEADRICAQLDRMATPICGAPLMIDAVCLFEQPHAGAPFRLTQRLRFVAKQGFAAADCKERTVTTGVEP